MVGWPEDTIRGFCAQLKTGNVTAALGQIPIQPGGKLPDGYIHWAGGFTGTALGAAASDMMGPHKMKVEDSVDRFLGRKPMRFFHIDKAV